MTAGTPWRAVEAPRFKKDYVNRHVRAEDLSAVRPPDRHAPPDGAVCLVLRRYKEGSAPSFDLLLEWRCPHCGLRAHVSVPETWIADGRLVFVERTEENCHISPAGPAPEEGPPCNNS